MSKFEVNLSQSFTITKNNDSSIYVNLTRAEAKELWFALGNKLNLQTEPKWVVDQIIPSFSPEPDLPVGSVIQDDSDYKDQAVRTHDGWQWKTLLSAPSTKTFEWKQWKEQSWTIVWVGGS